MSGNTLYYGDNLDILRRYIADQTIDLIYLDPPFNSSATYNVLFAEKNGSKSTAQLKAFADTWEWDQNAARQYQETVEAGGRVSEVLQAFKKILSASNMMAYLVMMAPRLIELHRALKETGSIYLHCDPTAAHYLRILLDAVFGPQNFRNEIIWKRVTAHSDAKRWSPVADVILYYAKSENPIWNTPFAPHDARYLIKKYRHLDPDGRRYHLGDMTSPNPRPNMMYEWKGHPAPKNGWRYSQKTMAKLDAEGRIWYPDEKNKRPRLKRYLDETSGMILGTVWTDIPPINSQAAERLGYPTQKPRVLLDRIISASSNEGDLILDPFCGCGTTIASAQSLNRRWIGIDITQTAMVVVKKRLIDTFGANAVFEVVGEPVTTADAEILAQQQPYQFQWWALGLVGARPVEKKKGADKGIDGRLYFHDEGANGKTKQIIFSVKAGKTEAAHVRDLRGVIEREKAEMGVLICMQHPTGPMRKEAAEAGFYASPFTGKKHPRLQILTIEQMLQGWVIDGPPLSQTNVTFKRAPKDTGKAKDQQNGLW